MDLATTLRKQADDAGYQIQQAFAGLPDDRFDHRAHPQMLTPREMAVHLTDCYRNTVRVANGEEPQWGSYQPGDAAPAELLETMRSARGLAVEACLSSGEKSAHLLTDYILLHDAYHVGQMCTIRLDLDPEWNAYSIYGM